MYNIEISRHGKSIKLRSSVTKRQYEEKNIAFYALNERRSAAETGELLETVFLHEENDKYFAECRIDDDCNDFSAIACCIMLGENIHKLAEAYMDTEWRIDDSIRPFPKRMVGFSLTNQCNLNCEMCWQVDRSQKLFASFDMISRIIDEIAQLGKPPIYLWGGEPLLHPDIKRIIEKIRSAGLFSIINTNGTMLSRLADELAETPPDMIIISIDGPEAIHDKIRGRSGTYKRVIEGIEKLNSLKKVKPLIALNCVVTEDNYLKLEEIEKLRSKIKANFLEYQLMMFFSESERENYKNAFQKEYGYEPKSVDGYPLNMGGIELNRLWENLKQNMEVSKGRTKVFPYSIRSLNDLQNYVNNPFKVCNKNCESINSALWIEADGNVHPCSNFTDLCVGNVYETDVLDIWNGSDFLRFRDGLKQGLFSICGRCCDMYKTDLFQAGR